MADKQKNVVLNFKMDGQVQYAKTLREINAVMNAAAKEYKNHVAAMGTDATATDKLIAEKKKLEIQMEAARKRTEMLRAQYEEMSKSTKTTTGQLTQMYNKLLDSERAEMSLQKSLDRVNDGLSEEAQQAREAQASLNELQAESKLLESEHKNLISSFKLQNAELGENASETEKMELAQKQIRQQMELTEKVVSNLEKQLEATKKIYGENSTEVNQMESKINDAKTTLAKFSSALSQVEKDMSEEAQQARNAAESLKSLQDESKLLEAQQKNLISLFKLQNAELGNSATEADKLELAQKQIRKQMELTEKVVANLEKQLQQSKKVYGDNSVEVAQLKSKLNNAKSSIAEFANKLDGLKTSGEKAGDGLDSIGKKLDLNNLMEASEQLQGLTDGLLNIGKSAMDSAMQFGDSQTNLQANLGLTAKEAEKLNGVVSNVFKNGVVDSMDEASNAVVTVKRAFGDLNNTDLEKLTNEITTIAKRTGTDVQENVNAAQKMMQSFGVSGEEAMDLIAAGYQNNLNKSGDFLDTLNEYSPLFKDAGFSANQMLGILDAGMKNGAMNTDKVADAVKELQIRFGDGTFEKNLGMFSGKTAELFNEWKNGKASMADVMKSIQQDMKKMDPTEQQAALTTLGTQFEDLGIKGTEALLGVGKGMDDVNGKADDMSKKSPGEKWQASLRELQQSLEPIGETLVDSLMPLIKVLGKIADLFGKLPAPIQTFIAVFGGISVLVMTLIPIIAALAASFGALDIAMLPVIAVIAAIAAVITGIILLIKNWGAITDWIGEKWKSFSNWIGDGTKDFAKKFSKGFSDAKDAAVAKFDELRDRAGRVLSGFKDNALSKASELKNGFVSRAGELKDGAVSKFNGLKNKAGSIIGSFKNNALDKASDLKSKFVNRAGELKDGALSRFSSMRDKAGSIFHSLKNRLVSPIEAARDKIKSIIDKIKGFFSGLKLKIPTPSLPKLPHFSLEWDSKEIFGKKIKYPTGFDVKWYANGAIFTQPTIFNTPYGLKGFGEAGAEAALPLNKSTLGAIGQAIAQTMDGVGGDITVPITLEIDGATVAQKTIKYTSRELLNLQKGKNRGGGKP
ncbi:phage tail tape measure protein [Heyndrickxia coagulans]|uniref:phage tail tape measure protein n=1 Tax=Heyndrickxia coagulans TaxID=1398 RepID=UPI0018A73483|nr:phage tail tape measure protein [Heyndrickxia coagulans]MBF8418950.1 phage tail tape measure protein [Heyndrickxia coagulans]